MNIYLWHIVRAAAVIVPAQEGSSDLPAGCEHLQPRKHQAIREYSLSVRSRLDGSTGSRSPGRDALFERQFGRGLAHSGRRRSRAGVSVAKNLSAARLTQNRSPALLEADRTKATASAQSYIHSTRNKSAARPLNTPILLAKRDRIHTHRVLFPANGSLDLPRQLFDGLFQLAVFFCRSAPSTLGRSPEPLAPDQANADRHRSRISFRSARLVSRYRRSVGRRGRARTSDHARRESSKACAP